MKLIIDIDKETYKKCKWKNNGVVGLEWWERAIANGIPLEQIRDESECSECGHREPNERFIFEDINFCAKCNAKMVEPQESEE